MLYSKMKGFEKEERLVYQIIEDSGNTGIWIRDIRIKSNLPISTIRKSIKALESKKLIKSVKSAELQRNHFTCCMTYNQMSLLLEEHGIVIKSLKQSLLMYLIHNVCSSYNIRYTCVVYMLHSIIICTTDICIILYIVYMLCSH